MKLLKRFMCGFMASLMLVLVPVNGYVEAQAAEVVVGVSAWEIMQTLMLSLGLTVTVQKSNLVDEACQEIVDTYNLWLKSNGFDDKAQLKSDLKELVKSGTSRTLQIAEDVWSGLRAWVKSLANDETAMDGSAYGFNGINSCVYTGKGIYAGGKYVVTGDFDIILETKVEHYGMISYSYDDLALYGFIVYSDVPFKSVLHNSTSSIWTVPSKTYDGFPPYNSLNESVLRESKFHSTGKLYYVDWTLPVGIYADASSTLQCVRVDTKDVSKAAFLAVSIVANSLENDKSLAYDVIPGLGGTAVKNGTWDIVTPGRTWDGEAVAGDVTIAVPDDIAGDIAGVKEGDKVVGGVIDLPGAPAIPVDTAGDTAIDYPIDIPETIDQVNSKTDESVTDTDAPAYDDIADSDTSGEYYVKGLQSVFPFCIPFDVIDFLAVLSAPAEAPCFKIPIKYPTKDGLATYEVEIDLSKFNSVAKILRTGETLLFCVGLAVATRSIYIRG